MVTLAEPGCDSRHTARPRSTMRQKYLSATILFATLATCQFVVGTPIATSLLSSGEDDNAILFGLCGDESRHGIEVVDGRPCNGDDVPPPVQMMRLHVDSLVQARFAHTVITSTVTNFVHVTHNFNFSVAVPDAAMVSGFILELDGDVYRAHAREKKNLTINTVSDSSADVSVRDAVTFDVVLTLEPRKSVEFTLIYEELLERKLGKYTNVVHLTPGQIVPDLQVRFSISESTDLSAVELGLLSNDVYDVNKTLASVSRPSPQTAEVLFAPSMLEQKQLAQSLQADPHQGINGHLSVSYDVDRYPTGGDIVVKDDYFAHFFAPTNLSYIAKHALFVLDVSGSMNGLKITQLKQAMSSILAELSPEDSFTVMQFSDDYNIWDLSGGTSSYSCNTYQATSEHIREAQALAAQMTAGGGTGMMAALLKAMECAQEEVTKAGKEPILLFLTDGQPTDGTPKDIIKQVTAANQVNGAALVSMYSLAFGANADVTFLRQLSLANGGDARAIYATEDAADQLQDFYRTIATPLLTDVVVTFDYENVDNATLTTSGFRTYFKGSELVVAGRMAPGRGALRGNVTARGAGGAVVTYQITSGNLDWWHPQLLDGTPSLERLWAFLKVSQQLDEQMSPGTLKASLHSETTALALQYSFVTPSTCLVVDWRNPEPSTTSPPGPATTRPSTPLPPAPTLQPSTVGPSTADPSATTLLPSSGAPSTTVPSTSAPSTTSPIATSPSEITSTSLSPPVTSPPATPPPPPVTVSTTTAPGPCKPGSVNSISIGTINIQNLSVNGPLIQ